MKPIDRIESNRIESNRIDQSMDVARAGGDPGAYLRVVPDHRAARRRWFLLRLVHGRRQCRDRGRLQAARRRVPEDLQGQAEVRAPRGE